VSSRSADKRDDATTAVGGRKRLNESSEDRGTWGADWSPRPVDPAAIDAGKHVLCEKPFAANAEEARLVADAATASGKFVR
jgi:hypothetical protein